MAIDYTTVQRPFSSTGKYLLFIKNIIIIEIFLGIGIAVHHSTRSRSFYLSRPWEME